MTEVSKYGQALPVSVERLLASPVGVAGALSASLDRALTATPQQRAEWEREAAQRRVQLAQQRADVRATTATTPLTLESLTARMGWSREYAEHLVQPYCGCEDDIDGWSYCEHARDLGLAP